MIKLVENAEEATLVYKFLNCDKAPVLAAEMFTEGFGVNQDFLQLYAAFNDNSKLCAAFVKCNDRVFCLINELYNIDEIKLFLGGFEDFKIFISSKFSHIIERKGYQICTLMRKCGNVSKDSGNELSEIDSNTFTNIIMQGKTKEQLIRFLLNNSHLQRHGYINNYANVVDDEIVSIGSLYNNGKFAYLCNVFTPEHYRHKGYGSGLINKITECTDECHLICTEEVSELYKKCGFRIYAKWIEFLY